MAVYRVYVEKKDIFAIESKNLTYDINKILGIKGVCKVRVINRYDVEGIDLETFEKAKTTIFSEPQVDNYYDCLPTSKNMFASEYLAGQFDQRADSCEQCIQITTCSKCPTVRTAKIFIVEGEISDDEFQKIKSYIINPVECKEASLDKKNTLKSSYDQPTTVKTLSDFNDLDIDGLHDFIKQYGLSMNIDDIKFCKDYFKNVEHRAPTITEIRIIDTYWSDHCRHTTFLTKINDVVIEDSIIAQAFEDYKQIKKSLGREDKPITLMDIATIAAIKLKADGNLNDLDESE
ncbi:MAG: phosphoribosylformylglycinamidine synthase, partial [Oscillospiraceae bacterium]|nr:phosphoribosylformylglycinamidine synthase [Oscillospiraceae bacterium]